MIRALLCIACWWAAFRLIPDLHPTASGELKLLFGLLMLIAVGCLLSLIFQFINPEERA
ncbi:hypothetical protein [Deinococcus sp. QL22]|uniref:hypothetical protein n=1 Tax=Deinococcus sp. QL22 TaxID=2939437 RepID=UPI002016E0A3|nr:hypothetical protein [Deinococcus sp. QL22]UQN06797.1 hypothetical protein M1R55_02415 [Deinococcus sp. QL22]